jgi:TonB family protein
MRLFARWAGFALTFLFAPRAFAQTTGGSPVPCDSLLRLARVDSVPATARAYLVRRDGELLPARSRTLLLETILSHLVLPKPLQLPVFSAGPIRMRMLRAETLGDSLTNREPLLYGVYDFTLLRYGAVSSLTTSIPTLVPGFDASVSDAIKAAVADSTMSLVPRALEADAVPLELRITTGPEDARFRVPPATVFAATFPRLRMVDAKPTGRIPLAQYPPEEQDEGGDGEVLLRVVIDENGAPVVPTLEIIRATAPAFARAAARTLARYHFAPAHVGACTVPQVAEMPFWFSLRP